MTEVSAQPRKRPKDMNDSERREHRAEYMRNYRREAAGEAAADNSETREEFWEKNRELLPSSELAALEAKQELVHDQQYWMKCQTDGSYNDPSSPHYCDPSDDQCYVGFEEGVKCLVEFVLENPCPHLGYFHKTEEIPPDWSTRKFWTNSELLTLLYQEGEATKIFVRYGLILGVPDWRVHEFLTNRAGWNFRKVCDLLGWCEDGNGHMRCK